MGSRRVRLTMTATAVATLLAAPGASAQVSAADRETARSAMQEGRDLRDKGDLKGALQRFKTADDIMHVPTTSLEVARAQVALGLLIEALDTIAAIRKTHAARRRPGSLQGGAHQGRRARRPGGGEGPVARDHRDRRGRGQRRPAISVDGVSLPAALGGRAAQGRSRDTTS